MMKKIQHVCCRTPSGVRGLKYDLLPLTKKDIGRTPSGVRGLKFLLIIMFILVYESHPVRGAWIEIFAVG